MQKLQHPMEQVRPDARWICSVKSTRPPEETGFSGFLFFRPIFYLRRRPGARWLRNVTRIVFVAEGGSGILQGLRLTRKNFHDHPSHLSPSKIHLPYPVCVRTYLCTPLAHSKRAIRGASIDASGNPMGIDLAKDQNFGRDPVLHGFPNCASRRRDAWPANDLPQVGFQSPFFSGPSCRPSLLVRYCSSITTIPTIRTVASARPLLYRPRKQGREARMERGTNEREARANSYSETVPVPA